MNLACAQLFFAAALWTLACMAVTVSEATELLLHNEVSMEAGPRTSRDSSAPRARRKRAMSIRDSTLIVDYHNLVRSLVDPPAANMENMVWDESLAASAAAWASECKWEHGPTKVSKSNGQNLAFLSGRLKSILALPKGWFNEKKGYHYPDYCSIEMCGHYTQMVWADSNKIGCGYKTCLNTVRNTTVWGTLLVCNYSLKGNIQRRAPYKIGKPCSACPSRYGGSCFKSQCDSRSVSRRNARGFRG